MATTINSYSVSLAMDASSYIKNSNLSRKETAALTRDINQARNPAEKYERQVNRLDKALKSGAISQATYNRLLREAKTRMDGASKSTSNLSTAVKGLASSYAVLQTVRVLTFASELAADAESTAVAFKVLIGDAQLAQRTLSSLNQFAASTPFQQKEIQDAGRMLLAFNFSTHELNKELRILGNLAAGTNQRIGELAELVGKARVQTTIYTEDLNQFTGRGINVLDGLAKRFGVTTAEVKKLASESKITFGDLQVVLEELTTGTGKFNGLIEEQAETVNGKLSTAWDNLASILRATGEQVNRLLVDADKLVKVVTGNEMTGWLSQFGEMAATQNIGDPLNRAGDPIANWRNGPGSWDDIRNRRAGNRINAMGRQGLLPPQDYLDQTRPKAGLPAPTGPASSSYGFGKQGDLFSQSERQPGTITGLDDAMQSGLNSLGSSITGGFDYLGGVFGAVGGFIAQANENAGKMVAESQKDSPAIKSLEVGTQEAYSFLTDSINEQKKQEAAEAAKRERIAQNTAKMAEKIDELREAWNKMGFKRI